MALPRNRQSATDALLYAENIVLDYGDLTALDGLSLGLRTGEVHAIVGEHGAGKSSLARTFSGMERPTSGCLYFGGRAHEGYNLEQALRLRIRMVYQDISLNESFTVAENLFFADRKLGRSAWHRTKRQEREAARLFSEYGFDIEPGETVQKLSLSDKTVVEILKNLYVPPRVLILDESLEKLSASALAPILQTLKQLTQQGMALLFVTHRIDEVYDFADRVTILRAGQVLLSDAVHEVDKINLIRMTYTQVTGNLQRVQLSTDFRRFFKYNEAVLQHLPVNLIVTDPDLNIQMINQAGKAYFGISARNYRNMPLAELFAENEQALGLIRAGVGRTEVQRYYQVQTVVDGKMRASNVQTVPIFDSGNHIGSIIIIEDITEYDQLQKQLILSEKLASVGLLAAGVAHEINNPLEIISNYLTYIKYTYDDPGLNESIERVREEMRSISNIVSNLVSFSDNRAQTNERVSLNDTVDALLSLVKYNAKYKHIQIAYEPLEDDVWFEGSRDEIKQVILNLLKNSFEAMPEGGHIRITTASEERDGAPMARVDFEDTGPGIDDENPNNIFLPFYSTKSGVQSKMGLGLSVSYNIIERYNGRIFVENLPARGCRFTILLPYPHQEEPAASS